MAGSLGELKWLGDPFDLDRTTCTTCGRPVLWVSRSGEKPAARGKQKSALYDRIVLDASFGSGNPQGTRHVCPGPGAPGHQAEVPITGRPA